ncbi:MAG: FtsX-like permease family protein [Acidobacteria bacterium]|nr:FtsX-like permease family protein [Acidobacteriota bacterium]
MLWTIAWRNVWRNRRRSALTLATIVLAVVLGLLMRSMQYGQYGAMIDSTVARTGHVQVFGEGYWDNKSLDRSIHASAETLERVNSVAGVADAVPRLESFALISFGERTKPSGVIGTNPEIEDRYTALAGRIVEGRYLEVGERGIILLRSLASYLGAGIGDDVVLLGGGYRGQTAADLLPVVGIFDYTLMGNLETGLAYVPLDAARELYATPPDQVTSLSVMLDDGDAIDRTAETLQRELGNEFDVMTWRETSPEVVQGIQSDSVGGIFMLAILYVVAGFGLLGTVLMSTMERRREFGVMNAVGMRKGRLAFVLFMETLVLVFVGVVLGLIVSVPIITWFHYNPIPVTGDLAAVFEQFNVPPYMPFSVDLGIFLAQGFVVLVMALIVASFPIVSIRRLHIMRAITGR